MSGALRQLAAITAVVAATALSGCDGAKHDSPSSATSPQGTASSGTASASTTANAPAESGVSNGKTYSVTMAVVEGSKASDNKARWRIQYGQLASGDPKVARAFNDASKAIADDLLGRVISGDNGIDEWTFEPETHVTFRSIAIGQVITGTWYSQQAAHPVNFVITNVWDSRGTPFAITLDNVFANKQDGLNRLSEQTKILLPKTWGDDKPMSDQAGNAPHAENFANWIPTAEGMQIYFPSYQFSLPGKITVPWSALTDVLAPDMAGLAQG